MIGISLVVVINACIKYQHNFASNMKSPFESCDKDLDSILVINFN